MSQKDAYYFPHDSNARNDPRIMVAWVKFGLAGYGAYWAIVEMMREQSGYRLELSDVLYQVIAMALRCTESEAKAYVDEFVRLGLFSRDTHLYSESLMRRMANLAAKQQERADAGRRGGLAKASKLASSYRLASGELVANASSRVEKSRVEESRVEATPPLFEDFWSGYPRPSNRPEALAAWRQVVPDQKTATACLEALDRARASQSWRDEPQFIPYPAKWLRERRWEEWLTAPSPRPVKRCVRCSQPALGDRKLDEAGVCTICVMLTEGQLG